MIHVVGKIVYVKKNKSGWRVGLKEDDSQQVIFFNTTTEPPTKGEHAEFDIPQEDYDKARSDSNGKKGSSDAQIAKFVALKAAATLCQGGSPGDVVRAAKELYGWLVE